MEKIRIQEIAKPAGGVVALSIALGLSRAAVSQWTRVPAERVIAVERITGIPREDLRPDLYPNPQDGIPAADRNQEAA